MDSLQRGDEGTENVAGQDPHEKWNEEPLRKAQQRDNNREDYDGDRGLRIAMERVVDAGPNGIIKKSGSFLELR
jgi:hypothetical protein